jgi:hypothetical protein
LFADARHVEVEATWGIYLRMIPAYRDPDPAPPATMVNLIDSVSHGVPEALTEITTPGRTVKKRPPTSWRTPTDPAPANTSAAPPGFSTPHELHRTIPTRDRRLQTPTTPSIMKSPKRWSAAFAQAPRVPCGNA